MLNLEWIIEQHILSRQFQQHGIVEELVDGHILREALASTSLDHEFTCQMRSLLRFQWTNDYALVQRISRHNLPVMEHRQAEGLTLGVCAQICLEAKRINCGYKGFDSVDW